MAIREMPTMMSATLASSTSSWNDGGLNYTNRAQAIPQNNLHWEKLLAMQAVHGLGQQSDLNIHQPPAAPQKVAPAKRETAAVSDANATATRRLVQVFIADPDENVPLDKALLYTGEQKLTDLSDQELFFDLDISGLLKKHNEARVKLTDKKIKTKSIHLEPARIRDLRMTVVTIASF